MMDDAFRRAALEAALNFFARFFIYERQPLIAALLGSCNLALTEDDWLEIYCPNMPTVEGLWSVRRDMALACRFLCLPDRVRLRIGSQLIREADLRHVPNHSPNLDVMTMNDLQSLYPPGISEAELITRVLMHPMPAVLVIEEAVVAVSQPYADLTHRSISEWVTDWVGEIHGNQSRHLPGVRERLVEDLERSPNGLLLDYQWPAIFCVDSSIRRFRGHFQRVSLPGGRSGRFLVLTGVPEPIESPDLIHQGVCR